MRRLPIPPVFTLMLALSLLFAAVATAASLEEFCDMYPDHQRCTDTTTRTTTPSEPPAAQPCESGTLPVATGSNGFVCEWTPEPDGSDVGTVAVEVASGSISGLAIFVVDSLPGNICVLEQFNKPTEHESASFPLVEQGPPAGTPTAPIGAPSTTSSDRRKT